MQQREADVVIVGAGLAGLIAATDLVAAGLNAVVVEARDRVGGRLLNHDLAPGKALELGGQWIGPGQDRMRDLAHRLGLRTFPTFDSGEHVLDLSGRVRRYQGSIPKLGAAGLLDVARAQRALERLARSVPLERPWAAGQARKLDRETFETWIGRNLATSTGRRFYRGVAQAVFGVEAESLSLLHTLFYLHSGQGLDSLLSTTGGAQQDRFVGGSQLVAIRLAEALGDRVRLGSPVRRISQDSEVVTVEADGIVASGRRAIVAVPPTLAGRIDYVPALPAARDLLTQRMPHGSVIKVMALYDTAFWRDEGLSGQVVSADGPITFTFDNSPPDTSPGVLVGFFEGAHAVKAGTLHPAERRQVALDFLVRYFGQRAGDPFEYIECDWAAEPWTRGCYGAHFPPGALTQFGPALRAPVGRVHWSGTETAEHWTGYMDGAVESGSRAAREVLAAL